MKTTKEQRDEWREVYCDTPVMLRLLDDMEELEQKLADAVEELQSACVLYCRWYESGHRVEFDPVTLTKGEAGRLLSRFRK